MSDGLAFEQGGASRVDEAETGLPDIGEIFRLSLPTLGLLDRALLNFTQRIEASEAKAALLGDVGGKLDQALARIEANEVKTAEIGGGVRTIEDGVKRLQERLRQTEEAAT